MTAAMTAPLIQIEDMSAGYAGIPVVRGLNLRVGPGEVVALLGPNGAGKTTTLLTCSGIVKVLAGSVTILGQPVHYGSPHRMARLGLGHVAEDRSLFFQLTGDETVRLDPKLPTPSGGALTLRSAAATPPSDGPKLTTKTSLAIGTEIKLFGYQAKSGEPKGVGVFVEYLDGRKIFMGGSAPGADGNPTPTSK